MPPRSNIIGGAKMNILKLRENIYNRFSKAPFEDITPARKSVLVTLAVDEMIRASETSELAATEERSTEHSTANQC
jgi:hypothetical protein